MTKGYLMNSLIEKMQNPDQDFRYMGLNDLMNEIKTDPTSFSGDESVENKVINQVLSLVEDKISEVKNQAVKCLGALIKILRQSQMELFSSGKEEELRDISGLALKTIASETPSDSKIAVGLCGKLVPRLLEQVKNSEKTPPETLVETLSVLSILIQRFSGTLAANPPALTVLAPLLSSPRPVVRKRAILTISHLVVISPPAPVSQLVKEQILPFLSTSAPLEKQRTTVSLVAGIARLAPSALSAHVSSIVPGVLALAKSDKEDEELREGSLGALEAVVVKMPTDLQTAWVDDIAKIAATWIKYDPNYAGDDEDEEMGDAEDDEDDDEDELDDEYEDDEDTSYKIRRASTKLLSALIVSTANSPASLKNVYKTTSPVLISRFSDREETVRLEVWDTYGVLLKQTVLYGSLPTNSSGKRKRDSEERDIAPDSPIELLTSQVPSFAKALLGQLKGKKVSATQYGAAFSLLHSLLIVLPGALTTQTSQILTIAKGIFGQSSSSSTTALHLNVLSFLSLFFETHPPSGDLDMITPALLASAKEKHPRVAAASLGVFSSLLTSLKPLGKSTPWIDQVYTIALERLAQHDTDASLRTAAEELIADLWLTAPTLVTTKGRKEWTYICSRDSGVRVVLKVTTGGDAILSVLGVEWVQDVLSWFIDLVKAGGSGKGDVFVGIGVLARSYGANLPPTLPQTLIPLLKPYLTTSDIPLLTHSLTLLTQLLEAAPAVAYPLVEKQLLTPTCIYSITASPLVTEKSLDALLAFLSALIRADNQIANHAIPGMVSAAFSAGAVAGATGPSYANVAKCIGVVVKTDQSVAAGVTKEYSKPLSGKGKKENVVIGLLIVGEVGRFVTLFQLFDSDDDEVRSAAGVSAGGVAIGNMALYLPELVKIIQSTSKRRILALHALKEVVTNASLSQLEHFSSMLWEPLFKESEEATTGENVAAACLGRLVAAEPGRWLSELHGKVKDAIISAVRITFTVTDTSPTFDALLAPIIGDFLSLISDEDKDVRRVALGAFASAARSKPQLLLSAGLSGLLEKVYAETVIKPELIRTVQMGPWTHKVDEGLEGRKGAFEGLYTLVDTLLPHIPLPPFLARVLSHMMLFPPLLMKLPERGLEKTAKGIQAGKDTVKQDLERAAELQRSAGRAIGGMWKAVKSSGGEGTGGKFEKMVDELKRMGLFVAELE
ncbi:armadillo-type protein [Flagelloscypha sp. PMI_526]|nr:armadillo-type protein [Flagelloscypha sp. PMI_526]